MRKDGYSDDGYIIDQAKMADIRYGCRTSDYNGCGWIAVFNFLHGCGEDWTEEELAGRFLKWSLFRGLLGTSPLRIRRFLRLLGYPVRTACGRIRAIAASERMKRGILLYRHTNGWHFICINRTKGGQLRFLNALPNRSMYLDTMENFLNAQNLTKCIVLFYC